LIERERERERVLLVHYIVYVHVWLRHKEYIYYKDNLVLIYGMSRTPPKQNPGARDWEAVPASYKTPTVLLIYIVKSSKSIVGDREKKRKLVIEVKDPFTMFRVSGLSILDYPFGFLRHLYNGTS
jgi:hypothetical protein